ncbi:MAG: chemotaxis protein CheW [Polyangiaceae bacterium]|nr:chemotaxis protein CheW [Polyangiaceae bacterium]
MISDCWNRVGVRGDRSCIELRQHSHCHNCPVYRAAAVTLLDRELTAEQRREQTRQFAEAAVVSTPGRASALVFRVAAEWLALPPKVFVEVAEACRAHSLPHQRSEVISGIANVRGELIVTASLRVLLSVQTEGAPPRRGSERVLVLAKGAARFACSVDEVHGLLRYDPDKVSKLPATLAGAAARFSAGMLSWEEGAQRTVRTVSLLDDTLLFEALNRSFA